MSKDSEDSWGAPPTLSDHTGQGSASVPELIDGLMRAAEVGDYSEILTRLESLNMTLIVSQESVLRNIPVEELMQVLISCVSREDGPDLVLSAITCLNTLLDLAPKLARAVRMMGILGIFAAKLMNFEYIDLAEYMIRTLEKISIENGQAILEENVLGGMVGMIDFFEMATQKRVVNIAINIVKKLSELNAYKAGLAPYIGAFVGMLECRGNSYKEINTKGIEFFIVLVDFLSKVHRRNAEGLKIEIECLSLPEIVQNIIVLVSTNPHAQFSAFKLLRSLCKCSSSACSLFLSLGGLEILIETIEKIDDPQEAGDALGVGSSLLPVPKSKSPIDKEKKIMFIKSPLYLKSLCKVLLPSLIKIYDKISTTPLRRTIAETIDKLVALSPSTLVQYTQLEVFASFLSELLTSADLVTVKKTLETLNSFYEKIPNQIASAFAKEGVISRVQDLQKPGLLKEIEDRDGQESKQGTHQYLKKLLTEKGDIDYQTLQEIIQRKKGAVGELQTDSILSLCENILSKQCAHHTESSAATSLSEIAQGISVNPGEVSFDELVSVLNTGRISHFEFSSSGVAEAIWDWLVNTSESSLRLQEFFAVFLAPNSAVLEKFVSLLVNSVTFVHVFSSVEKAFKPPNINIDFVYSPQDPLPAFVAEDSRHKHFSELKAFNGVFDLNYSFEGIKQQLKKIKPTILSEEDDPEYIKNDLEVELFVNNTVVPPDTTIISLTTANTLTVNFQFTCGSGDGESSKLVDGESYLLHLIEKSMDTGLSLEDKATPYLRLLKLIYLVQDCLPNLLLPSSIFPEAPATPRFSYQPPLSQFISGKLTGIISRLLQNPPYSEWALSLPLKSKFLFPFQTRCQYFYGTFLSQKPSGNKQKVEISRENILESALGIFSNLNVLFEGPLEVQYPGEVGTGIGPTNEFYSLLAKEYRELSIWRPNQENGLFPSPVKHSELHFEVLGKIVGKCLVDRKQLDLPLSPVFWKLVANEPVTLLDVQLVDPALGKTLLEFQELLNKPEKDAKYRGTSLESLEIPFTLPGYDEITLKPDGTNTLVIQKNIEEYINLVTEYTLMQLPAVKAFKCGLEALVSADSLGVFTYSEIETLVCGEALEQWDLELLQHALVPEHGYTKSSASFQNLLNVLSRFTPAEQRQFVSFMTGFPRLPKGGLAKLTPNLTVVRKYPNLQGLECDKFLPSVMTCQNYLKLPAYSTVEVLEARLKYSIFEGCESFHLS